MSQCVSFKCKSCGQSIGQSITISLRAWSKARGAVSVRFCSWRCFMAWVGQPRR